MITTTARLNDDQLLAAIGVQGVLTVSGGDLTAAVTKTISHSVATDSALQTAVDTASAQFVDRDANQATLQSRAQTALAANDTFLALASPSNAQVAAQVKTLTRECSAVIRLLLGLLDTTSGT